MDSLQIVEHCVYTHGEQAWRLAVGLMGNAADADDVLQQSFIVAWRKSGSFPRDSIWPWLAGIITGEARNARRKRARRSHAQLTETTAMIEPDDRADLSALLDAALRRLPDEQREALVLTHLSGMTHEQAAKALHVSVNTLKSRVRRGLDALRQKLRGGDGEITLALAAMPVALPKAGFAAARVTWMASVKHYAAGAAAAGASTAKIKTMVAAALAALLVVALMLWMFEKELGLRLTGPDVAEFDAPESRPSRTDASERNHRRNTGRKRTGRAPEGIPGEQRDARSNRAADSEESGAPADESAPDRRAGEVVGKEDEIPEVEVRTPVATNFDAPDRVPVLWIEQWPPRTHPHRPGSADAALAISLYERMQGDERYTINERVAAVHALPNGSERAATLILKALSSPRLHERVAAQLWVARENERNVLTTLDKSLFSTPRESDVRPLLLVPMFRNPRWVNEEKWRAALKAWSSDASARDLLRRLILELGHARGHPNNLDNRKDNRMRAGLLLGLAAQRARLEPAKRDPGIDASLNLALECLTRAGYTDEKHRGKANRKLRARSSQPEILMRLRREFDVNESTWNVTTIDVEGARETDLPLIILQDPDMSEELYLPSMVEVDLHFRCYLIDYRRWTRDLTGDYSGTSAPLAQRGPEYVAYLAERLDELCERLELRKYVVLAPGFMGAVAMELCRRTDSAKFALIDAWPSYEYLIKRYTLERASSSEPSHFRAEMLRIIGEAAESSSNPDRLLIDEAIMDNWLGARFNLGGGGADAFMRSGDELVRWMQRPEPHPAGWLSHYDFTGRGSRPRQPVVLLRQPERVDLRTSAAFEKVFASSGDTPDFPKREAIWQHPPAAFVVYMTTLLEHHRVVPKRRD